MPSSRKRLRPAQIVNPYGSTSALTRSDRNDPNGKLIAPTVNVVRRLSVDNFPRSFFYESREAGRNLYVAVYMRGQSWRFALGGQDRCSRTTSR